LSEKYLFYFIFVMEFSIDSFAKNATFVCVLMTDISLFHDPVLFSEIETLFISHREKNLVIDATLGLG
jgi:hypothetical protein